VIKITHVITSTSAGGAQMMLYKLLCTMDRGLFDSRVVSLTDVGPVGERIAALGVPVQDLGMSRGVPDPLAVLRLAAWLRRNPADVVQTWMYHSDLVGGLAALIGGGRVIWGIRFSNFDPATCSRATIWTARACAALSRWLPTRIVCCSEASRAVHAALGYRADKMIVIPNGFDLAIFRPDSGARGAVRAELGIPPEALLIGLVGRFDPQKDQRVFLRAASSLAEMHQGVHFLLCGDNITPENRELANWIDPAIRQRCHLLGRREDLPRLTAALDVATSSSAYGEAFSNAIGEAMACAVPCVVTDVGDSARIVGDTGKVVPPREPRALAAAWSELVAAGEPARRALGLAARGRVEARYSLGAIVRRYEALYRAVAVPAAGEGLIDSAS
jgi:glycosyltransferase involved in cell wall biosynthesis